MSYPNTRVRQAGVRRFRRVGAGLLAALVAIAVVAVAAVGSLWLSLAGIKRDPTLLPQNGAAVESVPGALNLLLIGTDSHLVRGNADVMMLVHLDASRKSVHLISVPRDLLIERPDGAVRLSRVYADGGSVATVEAVQQLLGIHIDHVALTWLNGMSRLIDLLGGVPVDNPVAASSNGFAFPRGQITLSGEESLAFVRQGPTGPGELDRAESQRLVLQGIATRLLTSSSLSNPGTVKAVLDQLAADVVVDSDLDARRMVELFVGLRVQAGVQDLRAIKLPTAGRGTTPTGDGFVRPDPERMITLGRAINSDTLQDWVRNR
ncbi:MAG TPA: LCP family protein [Micropruina sp.]|nr:LCP family protein [Micropruina sp.]